MAKVAFSRSDVAAINGRMSSKGTGVYRDSRDGRYSSSSPREGSYAPTTATVSRAPASPVAAKVLREVGVSSKKITEAYSVALARTTAVKSK